MTTIETTNEGMATIIRNLHELTIVAEILPPGNQILAATTI